jgi:LPS export ABC transporter protein LptC
MVKLLIIILFIASILVAVSRYLLGVEADYNRQLLHSAEPGDYTHHFKEFTLTSTNATGSPDSVIYSPNTRASVAEQKTVMDSPEITMYREQEKPIRITADSAEVFHRNNITVLNNNVHVSIPDRKDHPIVMTTEQLTFDNVSQTAKTELAATIVNDKGVMHGTGMEFNPVTQQIKFLNNVHGVYEH